MRGDLERLLPQLSMQEYGPVGFPTFSKFRSAWLWICLGYRGWARKVWVEQGSRPEDRAVVSLTIEELHCGKEAHLVANSRPPPEVVADFSAQKLEITQLGSRPGLTYTWNNDGLYFERRETAVGRYSLASVAAAGSPAIASKTIETALNAAKVDATRGQRRCPNRLWNIFWQFGVLAPWMLVGMFVPAMIAFAIAPDPVPLFVVILGGVATIYCYQTWATRRQREYQRQMWQRAIHDGDFDDTVRRALASIGVELPAAPLSKRPK